MRGGCFTRIHLDDDHLDANWETLRIHELFQKGLIRVVIRLLAVAVELRNFISLSFRPIRGQALNHPLFASQ